MPMIGVLVLAAGLAVAPTTFTADVAPVLAARCAACHRTGGPAPFALTTFDEVRPRARSIVAATRRRSMPPWMPDASPTASASFEGVRRLSDVEIAVFERWARDGFLEGAATGPPADVPKATSWPLGTPDLVIKVGPFSLPAAGEDVFRTFVVPASLTKVRYVRAFEFRPGSTGAVHHANIKVDRTASSRALDAAEPGPGYEGAGGRGAAFPDGHFLGWTPGQTPRTAASGLTWALEPGADLVFELHLMPAATPQEVEASLGLYFDDDPPQRLPVMIRLGRQDLDIAPGQAGFISTDSYVLPVAASVHALQPHAHRLATRVRAWATLPDGSLRPLLLIPRWNMSWQDVYVLQRPLYLPAGSRLAMEIVYDNSAINRDAPVPPRRVRFGQTTRSEMGDLWIQVMPEIDLQRPQLVTSVSTMMLRADISGVETMVDEAPEDARLRTDLGFCYLEAGRVAEAVEQLRRAALLSPTSAPTQHDFAVALLRLQRYAEARVVLESTIRLQPSFAEAYVNLGVVASAEGRTPEALEWFQRGSSLADANATAHHNLGVAYAQLGQTRDALRHFERAMAIAPPGTSSRLAWSRTHALDGRVADAVSGYRAVLATEPRSLAALLDLSWILSHSADPLVRRPAEAVRLAEQALRTAVGDPATSLDVLAAAYAADGQVEKAIEAARRALVIVTNLGGPAELRAGLSTRLAAYERKRPRFRQ